MKLPVLGFLLFGLLPCSAWPPGVEVSDDFLPNLKKDLEPDGFIVTDFPLNQGFSAYIDPALFPLFITSDSVLMGWNCLLERMMSQRHLADMGTQIAFVAELARHIPKKDAGKPGARETRLWIGCAHRILFGAVPPGLDDGEKQLVEAEAKRVEAAEGRRPPGWWKDDSYMPYSRFVPTGSWDRDDALRRYFRYRQWMQSLPVSAANDLHLQVCRHLWRVMEHMDWNSKYHAIDSYGSALNESGILSDLWEIHNLDEFEREARQCIGTGRHFLFPRPMPDIAAITAQLREHQALDKLTPCVATILGAEAPASLPPLTPKARNLFQFLRTPGRSNDPVLLFMQALTKLNAPADPRAPALFRTPVWRRKQLVCTMGAWAEYRHAVALSQTTSAYWMGMFKTEPGFVEPFPDFYLALAKASEALAWHAKSLGEMTERFRAVRLALDLEQFLRYLRRPPANPSGVFGRPIYYFKGHPDMQYLSDVIPELFPPPERDDDEFTSIPDDEWDFSDAKERKQLTDAIETACRKFWRHDADTVRRFRLHARPSPDLVSNRAYELAILCLRLEKIARKQLAGTERSDAEKFLIQSYGKTLAHLMFYEGNSYLSPKDDAPKITQIAHLGQPGSEQVLQCGVAQPRLLFIQYPDPKSGKPIICQSAVYAYRERISDKPVSDSQWRAECRKSTLPAWIKACKTGEKDD